MTLRTLTKTKWMASTAFLVLLYFVCVKGCGVAGETPSRFYSLCVGMRYPGSKDALRFTTDDVRKVAEAFRRTSGYAPDSCRVEVLVDDDPALPKPRPAAILRTLTELAGAATHDDRLVFYFSGHGILDDEGRSVLVCGNGPDDTAGLLRLSEIREALEKSRSKDKLVIVDACHSGGKSTSADAITPDSVALALGQTVAGKGESAAKEPVAWLVSCGANEKSWEDPDAGHGLFTRFFLEAIGDLAEIADIDYDGMLSLPEIHMHVTNGIAAYIRDKNIQRAPSWRGVKQRPRLGFGINENAEDLLSQKRLFYYDSDSVKSEEEVERLLAEAREVLEPAIVRDASGLFNMKPAHNGSVSGATKLLRQAASLNTVPDSNMAEVWALLGRCLIQDGHGDRRNFSEGVEWLRRGAEAGCAAAQNTLGFCYSGGFGIPKNNIEAAKWYLRAAEQGHAQGQGNLGLLYFSGSGVPKDEAEAIRWITLAAEQGAAYCQTFLGNVYSSPDHKAADSRQAMHWYGKAAEQGDERAYNGIGMLYFLGHGVTQNYIEAAQFFKQAADAGDAVGQFNYGFVRFSGLGIPQSKSDAKKWFQMASEQGYEHAAKFLRDNY